MKNALNATRTLITVARAIEILKNNPRNRPFKPQNFVFLCEELLSGRWKFNGDTIRIGIGGLLIDGQHRLEAVIKTGIPIDTLLITGLDHDVFDTIDVGARRSGGDTLSIAGEKNGRNLASALVLSDNILSGKTDFIRRKKTSNAELLNMLERHPKIRESVKYGNSLNKLTPPSLSISMHYIFSKINQTKADNFFDEIATGADLNIHDPALLLRQRLFDNATAKGKLTRRYMAALFIKSWNSYSSGKKIKTLRFREVGDAPESFPILKI